MSSPAQDVESALIESVCERVRERVAPEEVAEAEAFVRQYYRRAPAADLKGREPVDLYGAALAHWAFGKDREPGETRVRAYNPTFEQHGWQSPHTAIDVVSDDMPFLVDSVSMELSRRELGIHVLVHPVVGDESYMHIEVDRRAEGFDELETAITGVLEQVRAAVEDWQPMRERMQALLDEPMPAGMDTDEFDGGAGAARLGRRPPLHLPRLPRVRAHRGRAARGRGLGARAAARRRGAVHGLREAAGGRARAGPRTRPARAGQGDHALAGAPPRVPGLHRRQEVRRRGQRRRRAALPRPLHDGRLPRGAGQHPGAAPEGAGRP